MTLFEHIQIMLFPLILSNIIHMILVKRDVLKFLSKPIWESAFGANKTWRGVFILIALNGVFYFLLSGLFFGQFHENSSFAEALSRLFNQNIALDFQLKYTALGMLLGGMYVLFELPNSWLKRRLGIGAGNVAQSSSRRWLFMLLDKSDSAFGVVLFYGWALNLDYLVRVKLFLISVLIHISFAWLLFKLRIKASI